MALENGKPKKDIIIDKEHGRKGKNDNWPGCTAEFVSRTEKRRKKNKDAKKARKKNRKK